MQVGQYYNYRRNYNFLAVFIIIVNIFQWKAASELTLQAELQGLLFLEDLLCPEKSTGCCFCCWLQARAFTWSWCTWSQLWFPLTRRAWPAHRGEVDGRQSGSLWR